MVEAGVDQEGRVTQEEPREDALRKTVGDVSTESPNRDRNQRPAPMARSLILITVMSKESWNRKRTLQRRLCCACFCSSDRTSSSCSAKRITAATTNQVRGISSAKSPNGQGAGDARLKLHRTLGVHGDEIVGVIVPAVAPPPPPPSRHRLRGRHRPDETTIQPFERSLFRWGRLCDGMADF